jgi:hypothetical protein
VAEAAKEEVATKLVCSRGMFHVPADSIAVTLDGKVPGRRMGEDRSGRKIRSVCGDRATRGINANLRERTVRPSFEARNGAETLNVVSIKGVVRGRVAHRIGLHEAPSVGSPVLIGVRIHLIRERAIRMRDQGVNRS